MSSTSCAICNQEHARLCQRCKSIAYCSTECQSGDWPCHKLVCAQLAAAADPESHDKKAQVAVHSDRTRTVRGVLFDPDSKHPQLVSIKCHRHTDEESGVSFQDADVEPYLGVDGAASERLFAEHNRVRGGRQMQSFVEVWYCPDAPADVPGHDHPELRANKSIVAATGGKMIRKWEGPVVVLAMSAASGGIVDPGFYRDITGGGLSRRRGFHIHLIWTITVARGGKELQGLPGSACSGRQSRSYLMSVSSGRLRSYIELAVPNITSQRS